MKKHNWLIALPVVAGLAIVFACVLLPSVSSGGEARALNGNATRWEYKAIRLGEGQVDALNELGKDGWELVAMPVIYQATQYAYLKRPLP